MPEATDPPPWSQRLLGVVIICNFVALLVSNFAGFFHPIPDATTGELPPPPQARHLPQYVADRWCEATGQPQGWGMFDSGAMVNHVWFEIEFIWPDGRKEVSRSVASDPLELPLLNLPAKHNRRAVYECAFLGRELLAAPPPDRMTEYWQAIAEDVRINHAGFDALFRSHYQPWHAGPVCREGLLVFHWRPVGREEVHGHIATVRWTPDLGARAAQP